VCRLVEKAVANDQTVETIMMKYSPLVEKLDTLTKETVPELKARLNQKEQDIQSKDGNSFCMLSHRLRKVSHDKASK